MGIGKTALVAGGVGLAGFLAGQMVGSRPLALPERDVVYDAAEMEQAVRLALDEPRAFPRSVALVRLYEGLSEENVHGARRAVDERAGRWDPVELQLFLTAWVHLDPESAWKAVSSWQSRSRREMGMTIVMREWAARGEALAATVFYDSLADEHARNTIAGPLVRGWALSGDHSGAIGAAKRFFDRGQVGAVDGLVRGLVHRFGAEHTLELIQDQDVLQGGGFEQRLARVGLNVAGREAPTAAAALYAELTPETVPEWLSGTLQRVAALLANEDAEDALEWVLARPPSAEREQELRRAMGDWASADFTAAERWFEATRTSESAAGRMSLDDSALAAGLIPGIAVREPAKAAEWVVRILPAHGRDELMIRLARSWSRRDATAAAQWIDGLDLPAPLAERMRQSAAAAASPAEPARP